MSSSSSAPPSRCEGPLCDDWEISGPSRCSAPSRCQDEDKVEGDVSVATDAVFAGGMKEEWALQPVRPRKVGFGLEAVQQRPFRWQPQPLVILQMQIMAPMRRAARTYGVAIEPGGASRCETPRAALRLASASPDVWQGMNLSGRDRCVEPSSASNKKPSEREPLNYCSAGGIVHACGVVVPMVHLPVSAGKSVSSSGSRSARARTGGNTARKGKVGKVAARGPERSEELPCRPESSAARQSPSLSESCRGKAQASPTESETCRSRARASPTDSDCSEMSALPACAASEAVWGMRSTVGALSEVSRSKQQRMQTQSALERNDSSCSRRSPGSNRGSKTSSSARIIQEEVYFEFGAGKVKLQKMAPTQRVKGQIRDLGQSMVQSMTRSFPRDVWEACEIPHPEIEREKVQAEVKAKPRVRAEQAAEKIKSLEATLFKSNPSGRAKSQRIAYAEEKDEHSRVLQEDRALAWLAKQTGWSILDVEEVRDIFLKHASDGIINVNSVAFRNVLGELYSDASVEEVKKLLHHITGVRRRSMVVQQSRGSPGAADRTEVRFNEFYLALARWLDHQKAKKVMRRCTLVRYNTGRLSADDNRGSQAYNFFASAHDRSVVVEETQAAEDDEAQVDSECFSSSEDDDGAGSFFDDGAGSSAVSDAGDDEIKLEDPPKRFSAARTKEGENVDVRSPTPDLLSVKWTISMTPSPPPTLAP